VILSTPIDHQDAKPSHQDLTLPAMHTATSASNQHNTDNSIAGNNLNHSNPTTDSTAPHNQSCQLSPAHNQLYATNTIKQTIHLIPTNAITRNLLSDTTTLMTPTLSPTVIDQSCHPWIMHYQPPTLHNPPCGHTLPSHSNKHIDPPNLHSVVSTNIQC